MEGRSHSIRTVVMNSTLVIQSQRSPLPYPWIGRCLASVRDWCARSGHDYRFIGDELFDRVPASVLRKTSGQQVIATDLARLLVLQEALREDYRTVVWLDADVLVFDPAAFVLPAQDCAVGREVWVQPDRQGRLKVYRKVHNAFLMSGAEDSFLDFYIDTAQRLLSLNRGTMPPQFIGPKLLTALHNVAMLPVLETAGMLGPLVGRDIIRGGGKALDRFVAHSTQPLAAANLCASSCERNEMTAREMEQLVDVLLNASVPS
jgi:hypothetical protein